MNLSRYRTPVVSKGVVFRRHKCKTCSLMFLSAQMAIPGNTDLARAFEELIQGRPLSLG